MKIKGLFLFLVVFLLVSCDNKPPKAAPTVLLSEAQMIDVMIDVQIMEGIINYKKNVNQKTAYIKTVGYDTLFAHHGITDSIFKLNLDYYSIAEPQALVRIVDSVSTRLARMKN